MSATFFFNPFLCKSSYRPWNKFTQANSYLYIEITSQVLFCSLTEHQKNLYKEYLRTDHVSSVLHDKSSCSENSYRARLLVALTNLRKICNHPDLYTYAETSENISSISLTDNDRSTLVIPNENDEESLENFGYWKRSGKLTVVRSLLKIWKSQAHRVLLFTQGRQVRRIIKIPYNNQL